MFRQGLQFPWRVFWAVHPRKRGVEVKERPILFSGPMVKALLEDRKTMTRREITRLLGFGPITELKKTDTPGYDWCFRNKRMLWNDITTKTILERCPYGQPGDRLWVRETFCLEGGPDVGYMPDIPTDGTPFKEVDINTDFEYRLVPHYRATEPDASIVPVNSEEGDDRTRWRPSIHIPRWASRILLEITDVRVERLHDITEEDEKSEGVDPSLFMGVGVDETYAHRYAFRELWMKLNGPDSWDANPWVWVVEFKRVKEVKE